MSESIVNLKQIRWQLKGKVDVNMYKWFHHQTSQTIDKFSSLSMITHHKAIGKLLYSNYNMKY